MGKGLMKTVGDSCIYVLQRHQQRLALLSELLFSYPDFCTILELARRHSSDIGQF